MEKNSVSLQIVNPHSAGIDIGSRMHVVAVDQNVENVRSFGVYHNMRRVNSRGMARANKHFLTAAICYNLKKTTEIQPQKSKCQSPKYNLEEVNSFVDFE